MDRWRRGRDTTPEPAGSWRPRLASRLLAAALYGAADAFDGRRPKEEPQVEEAPEPLGDDWLVLLDRQDPARSLVIVPQRVVMASALGASAPGAGSGHAGPGHPGSGQAIDNHSLLACRGGSGA